MNGKDYDNELVRKTRKSLGLSQKDLADEWEVHENTIARLENGKAASFSLLKRFASRAQRDVREFIHPTSPMSQHHS